MQAKNPIGGKITAIRNLKKIELQELAAKSNLSISQLNLIERGNSLPSLGILIRISRALGIRLGTLLDDKEKEGPSITYAKDHKLTSSFSTSEDANREHLNFFSLAPNKADRHMEPFLVDILPGESMNLAKSSHEGEEFIFVLEGKITVAYGTDTFELEKGDTIYLDSIVEHQITASGLEAKILGIVYIPV